MAFIDHSDAFTLGARPLLFEAPALASAVPSLSALEWLVVAVAGQDGLSSLREPGRLTKAMGSLFGRSHNRQLADGKLEALRRVAVRLWRQGRDYDGPEIPAFLAAGYTPAQFTLVADSIASAGVQQGNPQR